MIADLTDARADEKHAPSLLAKVAANFLNKPFTPARFLTQGDAQTIGAYLWPRRFSTPDMTGDEERLFDVEPGTRVLARCRWQPDRTQHPTVVFVARPGRLSDVAVHPNDGRKGFSAKFQRGAREHSQLRWD